MGISHYQESDSIVLPGYHTNDTLATTMLRCVNIGRYPLDKSPVTERHHYSLVRDKVFLMKFYLPLLIYLGSPGVSILGL